MKKLIALLLTLTLVFSLASCSGGKNDKVEDTENTGTTDIVTPEPDETPSPDENDTVTDGAGENAGKPSDETMGETLKAQFMEMMESGETYTLEALAQALTENDVIEFASATMEIAEGYLPGFSSDITGFKEGYTFGPVIGSIAFVGYVFTLEDGADVDSFVKTLEDNADPRWNICVEASETVTAASGNTVFFVMCP